jgi:hypothetical protein
MGHKTGRPKGRPKGSASYRNDALARAERELATVRDAWKAQLDDPKSSPEVKAAALMQYTAAVNRLVDIGLKRQELAIKREIHSDRKPAVVGPSIVDDPPPVCFVSGFMDAKECRAREEKYESQLAAWLPKHPEGLDGWRARNPDAVSQRQPRYTEPAPTPAPAPTPVPAKSAPQVLNAPQAPTEPVDPEDSRDKMRRTVTRRGLDRLSAGVPRLASGAF